MVTTFRAAVAMALVPAAVAFAGNGSGTVFKCGASVSGSSAWVVDGKVTAIAVTEGSVPLHLDGAVISSEDVDSIAISCSSEVHRVFGVEPGRDLVFVWTNADRPPMLKTSMDSLAPIQETYFAQHGHFAAELEELPWHGHSINVRLCVSEVGDHWMALGWQSSPADDYPRVLVGANRQRVAAAPSTSAPAGEPEARYNCELRLAPA